jgi:hypothetical protein
MSSTSNDGLNWREPMKIWSESHYLFINTTLSPETAWHDNFSILIMILSRQWNDKVMDPLQQTRDVLVPEWPRQGHNITLPDFPMWDMWGDPPRELLCANSIPIRHFIKHGDLWVRQQIWERKKKGIFRTILGRGKRWATFRTQLSKHERKEGKERKNMNFSIFCFLRPSANHSW